jgi:hypothetical protein
MRMFFFFTMVAVGLLTASCNNHNSGGNSRCDSVAITIAMLNKVTAVGFDKQQDSVFDVIASFFPKLTYAMSPSQIIDVEEARKYHQRYLGSANRIVDRNGDVVHFLSVNSSDLKTLYDNGKGGVRLYFCRENTNEFNIVLVPVDQSNRNVLSVGRASVLVNKLEPCPDKCIGGDNRSEELENDETDLNKLHDGDKWLKPNKRSDRKAHWWSKDNKTDYGSY